MLNDLYNAHLKKTTKPVPAGFKTSKEWAAAEGKSISATENLLNKLTGPGGSIEKKKFSILCGCGHFRVVSHYRKK